MRKYRFNSLGWISGYDTAARANAHGLCETNDIISILGDVTGLNEKQINQFTLTDDSMTQAELTSP
jgi:hypothetical protein